MSSHVDTTGDGPGALDQATKAAEAAEAATARAVVSGDGRVLEWNEGARRLLGYTPRQVVGRPAARLLAGTKGFVPDASPWGGTVLLRHRDGRDVSVWVLVHRRPDEGDWLIVTPLEDPGPLVPGDVLTTAAMEESPCSLVVYDERLRLRWVNRAMAGTIGLPEERIRGLRLSEIGGKPQSAELERYVRQVLDTGKRLDIETFLRTGGEQREHDWSARITPLTDGDGRVIGVCLAAHDITEHTLARRRLQLVNEASVRIGSTLDISRTAQELADVCVPALADFVSIDLVEHLALSEEPPTPPLTAPVVLRRAAHQSVTPGSPEAVVKDGHVDSYPAASPHAACLVADRTLVTEDPADMLAEWLDRDETRHATAEEPGVHSTMSVPIRARGATLGVAVLTRFRRPDPFTTDDVLLAEEVTARAGVCIDNARRYSRERETALALQRSLLPQTLPPLPALEAASRYLPAAQAGVGGDWFDVIPLSGMRVAMVVGDVVGHGVQASATMGRLRTAVRTLADVDLAPDELLTHLDDLVVRLSHEAGDDGFPGEVGATCLYAVYDPVSRQCSFARAGHPPPVMLVPGREPQEIDLPAGPPLGLGGLPFESAELDLPEGTVLALYTDGLIESRERDIDASRRLLSRTLAQGAGSLDDACHEVVQTLLPPTGAADDVALLLARTRGLPACQVATWTIAADPSLVAGTRRSVLAQLDDWGLSEASFVVELVVSELVTNAIVHGSPPIVLRLLHDATTLICEVSDASGAAPHMRRAKTYDEGGRGLLLVAQLTHRWGSRHTAEGKTIWAEITVGGEG
ncbi:SpoIIE family protein phosphatase [Streptomyces cavernae]|uniref:SpoIIE family protein phosphatase n=1 Tax=Streptomyces cavernae TaxID=2259034 RepID=UPI000FEBB019|nr:SpoIIE family protein phosphatase [Streptomyces cavernae]